MGKYALKSKARRLEFEDEFIPDNTIWRECNEGEDPLEDLVITKGTYPIYISFFRATGLKLPFNPLLMDFFRHTRFHIG